MRLSGGAPGEVRAQLAGAGLAEQRGRRRWRAREAPSYAPAPGRFAVRELGTLGDVETSEIRVEGEGGPSGRVRSDMWQGGLTGGSRQGHGMVQADASFGARPAG